jgi:hypothetical protein
LENELGELGVEVPAPNFHAPSKTEFHENGTEKEESALEGIGTSGAESTLKLAGGSTATLTSLGTGRCGADIELDSDSPADSGLAVRDGVGTSSAEGTPRLAGVSTARINSLGSGCSSADAKLARCSSTDSD